MHGRAQVNWRAILVIGAAALAGVAIVASLSGKHPLVQQCERQGGHLFSGPGGETVCIQRWGYPLLDERPEPGAAQ